MLFATMNMGSDTIILEYLLEMVLPGLNFLTGALESILTVARH